MFREHSIWEHFSILLKKMRTMRSRNSLSELWQRHNEFRVSVSRFLLRRIKMRPLACEGNIQTTINSDTAQGQGNSGEWRKFFLFLAGFVSEALKDGYEDKEDHTLKYEYQGVEVV